jgi:hypothetical protein
MALSLVSPPELMEQKADGGDTPLTPEDLQAQRLKRLDMLGATLAKRRDEWVRARRAAKIEQRWMDDINQYLGRDENARKASVMMDSVEAGFPVLSREARPQRSTVFVNITRPKTNAAEARVADMVFPVDDRNFGIKPTPVPELVATRNRPPEPVMHPETGNPMAVPAQSPQGEPILAPSGEPGYRPMTTDDLKQDQLAQAEAAARAMQDEIDDALTECEYNTQGRMMLHDAAVMGTGVFKGPIVRNQTRKAWQRVDGATYALTIKDELRPSTVRVDPWNVFPDPNCGTDAHDGLGIFERKLFTPRKLRDLAKQPGYKADSIKRVLAEGPQRVMEADTHEVQLRKDAGYEVAEQDHFEIWEYWGDFDADDMRAAGVDLPDDTLTTVSGVVIMSNNTVIKAYENPLEGGELPYDFFPWEKADQSPWGYSVPFLMRTPQRVLNAAWRQTMDNAGLSVGANVVIKPGIIQPADQQWTLTGRKIWWCTDEAANVKEAFATFEFPSHLDELMKIIELALKFADEETSVPKLAQGEQGEAPETVGGMTILMNSANVVLRRLVKQFDDYITRPHIKRYYDFFMLFSEKAEIKGDFSIDARGSSALLVKDMQQQALLQMGQYQGSPVVGPMVNWQEWFKEVLKTQHIDASKILKSDEEIKQIQKQPPPPDPRLQQVQIQTQSAEKIAQMKMQADMAREDHRQEGDIVYAQTERAMVHDNAQARLAEMAMKREMMLLEYANKQQLNLMQVKAQLANTAMQERTKRDLARASAEIDTSHRNADRDADAAKYMNDQENRATDRADKAAQSIAPQIPDQGVPQ